MFKCFFEEPHIDKKLNLEEAEFNNIPTVSSLLPYLQILDDKTVITKNYSFLRVIKITGFDNISVAAEEIESLFFERVNMLNNLSAELALNIFTFKNKSDIDSNSSKSSNPVINKITEIWNDQFKDIYDISLYIVVNKKK